MKNIWMEFIKTWGIFFKKSHFRMNFFSVAPLSVESFFFKCSWKSLYFALVNDTQYSVYVF